MPKPSRAGHTLLIHPGALGDVLLAIPALRALRAVRPGERIVLGAQERIGSLLTLLGAVDGHVRFDALGLDALFAGEGCERNERGPARTLTEASHVVSWFGARDPSFLARVHALVPGAVVAPSVGTDRLVWRHLLATVALDSPDAPADRTPLSVPASLSAEGRQALRSAGWDGESRLLMVHPGAGGIAKRWPGDGFAHVLATLGARQTFAVAVHQGPADAEAVADFLGRYRGPVVHVVDPPLPLLAGAMTHVAAWLGNDSGVSHLAAAIGVRALVLFKASNLAWRSWSATARPLVVGTGELRTTDADRVVADLALLLA